MSTATAPEPAAAERPISRARRLARKPAVRIGLAVLGFGAVTLVTCLIARYRIFTGFAPYDDEGYMLTALNSFIQHGSLYDDVFTQYGPFYYELWGGLFSVFGFDVSHDAGRTVTLVVWVLASLLVGLSAARMTSSVLLGLATQMLAFSTISTLVNEPMHPGGAICLLLGAILAISCAVGRKPSFGAMGLLGGAIAALILVKVNVGFFALAALALAAVVSYPVLGRLRWLRPLVEVGFVALPVVLMTSELGEGWARHYAVHVAAAALGVVIVLRSRLAEKRPDEELAWFAGGLVLTGAVICLAAIGAGTSLGGLFDGVISQPLRQGDAFTIPFGLSDRTFLLDLIALGGAFGYAYGARGREGPLSGSWLPAISLLSVLVGVEMGLSVIGKALPFDQTVFGGYSLSMLGFAWVALIPIAGESSRATSFARLLLPPLAVLQALHAFPVAGSQVAWSSFLLAPVAAVCVAGGVRGLARGVGEPRQLRGLAVAGSIAAVGLSVYLVNLTLRDPLRVSRDVYNSLEPLDLPGASRVRVNPPEAALYRDVTGAIGARCTAMVMLPGMDSFYLWAEQEPPTGLNPTAWPTLFDGADERKAIEETRGIPGLCLLENITQAEAWSAGPVPNGPLLRYYRDGFRPLRTIGPYRLLQRSGASGGQS